MQGPQMGGPRMLLPSLSRPRPDTTTPVTTHDAFSGLYRQLILVPSLARYELRYIQGLMAVKPTVYLT